MNQRLFGTLCIFGGVAYLINGLRFFAAGEPSPDLLDFALSSIWAVGGICGLLGMLAARVTGAGRGARTLSFIPIAAFLAALGGNFLRLSNPGNEFNPLVAIGLLGLAVGMLVVGVLTVRAGKWTGWKKAVPFLPALMPFIGMAIGAAIGVAGGVNVSLVGLSWMLLGYTVVTGPTPLIAAAPAVA